MSGGQAVVAAYRSHTTATSNTGSYTIARPAGITEGDILVLAQVQDEGTLTDITTPSGWTQLLQQNSAQTYTRGKVFVKEASGSEAATYSLAQGSGRQGAAILICVQDADLPAVSASSSAGSGSNISTPSVTPASASGIEVRFAAGDGDGAARTFTPPATYTEPSGADVNLGGFTHLTAAYKVLASASATGALNFTASGAMVSRVGFTIWLPSAATGTNATATPGVVSAAASIPSPTVQADTGATATPAVVTATASIPTPDVSDGTQPPELVGTVTAVGDRLATLTCAKPSGVQAGDLLIAHQASDVSAMADLTTPAGGATWQLLDQFEELDTLQVKIWWKIAGGSEPTGWNFTQESGADGTVIIAAYRGASDDTPTVAKTSAPTTASVPTPGITPPSPASVEIRIAAGNSAGATTTWTPPAGFTEQADVQSTNYLTATLATRDLDSATPTGTETFTASASLQYTSGITVGIAGSGTSAQDATATPATVEGSASVPAPQASAAATASPAVVAATASVPAPAASAGAMPTPAVVAASATVPAPALSAGAAAAPSTVQASASIPSPTPRTGSTASPAVVQASASIPAPSPSAGATAAPSLVTASATIPVVQVSAGSSASPSVVSGSASVPEPAVTAVTTASPDTVQAAASIPGPSLSAGVTATPDVVEATASVPAPTTSTGATASPGVVSATSSIPAPDATMGATASPAVVAATSDVPAPDVSAGATATPATVQATAAVPAPEVSGGVLPAAELRDDFSGDSLDTDRWTATNNTGVTGAQAAGVYAFEVGAAAVAYSQLASAGQYDLTGSHYTVELVDAGSQASGLEVYVVAEADASNRLTMVVAGGFLGIYKTVSGSQTGLSFPAYSPTDHRWLRIREDAGTTYWEASPDGSTWAELHSEATPITVTSTRLILQAGAWQALGADTSVVWDNVGGLLVSDATATPATVSATATIPAPTASAGATVAPGVVTASASIPAAAVTTSSTASPSVVAATADVPSPAASAGATASAAVVAAEATIPAQGVSGSSTASPSVVEALASIPGPSTATGATATPGTVTAAADIPTPSVAADGNATAQPATVSAAASIPGPSAGASSTATPAVVLATAAVPTPTTTVLVAATPAAVEAYASIPAALISTTARPAPVQAVASIPTPAVSTGDLPQEIDITIGPPSRHWSATTPGKAWQAGDPLPRRWSATAPIRR